MLKKLIEKITGKTDKGDDYPGRERFSEDISFAACVILLEAACSDRDMSDREKNIISDTLKEKFGLSAERAEELIQAGGERVRTDTNKWRFMDMINRNFSAEEKVRFIEQVWRIILSDGRIHKYEDHVAGRIASVLRVPHKKMIEAKIKIMREGA